MTHCSNSQRKINATSTRPTCGYAPEHYTRPMFNDSINICQGVHQAHPRLPPWAHQKMRSTLCLAVAGLAYLLTKKLFVCTSRGHGQAQACLWCVSNLAGFLKLGHGFKEYFILKSNQYYGYHFQQHCIFKQQPAKPRILINILLISPLLAPPTKCAHCCGRRYPATAWCKVGTNESMSYVTKDYEEGQLYIISPRLEGTLEVDLSSTTDAWNALDSILPQIWRGRKTSTQVVQTTRQTNWTQNCQRQFLPKMNIPNLSINCGEAVS